MPAALKTRVIALIAAKVNKPLEAIQPDARLKEDLSADSLQLTDLSMALDEDLGIVIEDDRWDTIHTVADLLIVTGAANAHPA